jgi:SAM-dependent methyltransferase
MKQAIKRMLGPIPQYIFTAEMLAKVMRRGFGHTNRECPICERERTFVAEIHFPDVFRFDSLCPYCTSLPRTRLLWLAIKRRDLVTVDDSLLHFAPEKSIADKVRGIAGSYRTADFMAPKVDLKLNIEAIDLPDASVDVIICSHVLEHVNDRLAIAELYRILKPGGRLLAMVPIVDGWDSSYESETPLDFMARRIHYGRGDHVRRYGRDFVERLAAPGFEVEVVGCDGADTVRYGLLFGENVFVARKPAA